MIQITKKLMGSPIQLRADVLSGITVALALVPEAVAFAFVAGVDPIVGLYGAFLVGLVTSVFGGRPGMISGATGAMAVVMVHLVSEGAKLGVVTGSSGLDYLLVTLLMVGALQILSGAFGLGKFVRLIPHPVMLGFVNGLAVVIFMSQLGLFKDVSGSWMPAEELLVMLSLVGLTMAIMYFLPKVTKAVPSGLVAILATTFVVHFFGVETPTILSFITSQGGEGIQGGLPFFRIPEVPFSLHTLYFIFPYAAVLAAIGLIESLMTLTLIDEMTETKGQPNRECMAQGLANVVNGFFGGMGGCAMIGQSVININSGGRGRASGVVASLVLLSFILYLSPYIEQVPIAALVGVMFMVVIGTFAWSSLRIMNKIPWTDAVVVVLVSVVTVFSDLAVAVLTGVVVSCLTFAWENAKRIRARKTIREDGTKSYEIWGPLFFGSVQEFKGKFTPTDDPKRVEVDFKDSRVCDHSGIEAIKVIIEKYEKLNKVVHLKNLSPDCKRILKKSGQRYNEIVVAREDDPHYYVAEFE